jgi:threonine dehydrogenase-like Zn-dependent dehydrogenase
MRAIAVVPERREVGIVDVPAPEIASPTQVKIRMLDVGVCGTDREICAFQYGTPPPGERHLVIGHESLGQVVETGRGVMRFAPGDLVVPMVRRPCPHAHCKACRAGRQDFCFTGEFAERGINGLHGFMTEMIVEDERWLHAVPAGLRDVGVLVEPLTIAEKALIQIDDVQERLPWACDLVPGAGPQACHRAVVLGGGPVGLLGAMALVARGFETAVYSRERAPNPKADLVAAIGGRWFCAEDTPVERLLAEIGNIDVVYEATGASSVAFHLMKALGTNGVFVFTGVPGRKAPIEIDTDVIMRNLVLKNQVVFGTVNAGPEAFAAAVDDLRVFQTRWPAALASVVSGRHRPDAYRELLLGPAQGVKDVIRFA